MIKSLLNIIIILFFINGYSQEKDRLALVIGNANYEKGELRNPVNDARLIASTLDSLNFDVILKENLETQTDFKRAIFEFGNKRDDYNIALVYYAGHGIQISGENYLLPTKEEFRSENEVKLFALSVQDIMTFLTSQSDKTNILILDACRDNPYESNFNLTRSASDGKGLAKIPPPKGSLIAFSTDSGKTAPDGKGENSVYTISLSKNLLKEDIDIDQVFRNVRTEVTNLTNDTQSPVEESKLTGDALILRPSTYKKEFQIVEDILFGVGEFAGNYFKAIELLSLILDENPENKKALYSLADSYSLLGEYQQSLIITNRLISLDSLYGSPNIFTKRGIINYELNKKEESLNDFNLAIKIDPTGEDNYYQRAMAYFYPEGKYEKALIDYKKALEIDPDDEYNFFNVAYTYYDLEQYDNSLKTYNEYLEKFGDNEIVFNNIALIYQYDLKNYEKALEYFNLALEIKPQEILYYSNRAELYNNYLDEKDKAINDYNTVIKLDSLQSKAFHKRGEIYYSKNKFDLAIEDFRKAIKIDDTNSEYYFDLALTYGVIEKFENELSTYVQYLEKFGIDLNVINNIALIYQNNLKNYQKALEYFNLAIDSDPNNALYFRNRGVLYIDYLNEPEKALLDFNKAIEIEPSAINYWYRAGFYYQRIEDYELALQDLKKSLEYNSNDQYIFFHLGYFYGFLNEFENELSAYLQYIEKFGPAENVLNNIANIYEEDLKNYEKAIEYYTKAIEINKNEALYYRNRGKSYDQHFNQVENSINDFKRAIEIENFYEDYIYLSYLYGKKDNNDLVISTLNDGLKMAKSSEEKLRINYAIGEKLKETDVEKELNIFKEIEKNDTENFISNSEPLFSAIGDIYLYLKEYDLANFYYSKEINNYPNYYYGYYKRADLYTYQLKDF